MSCGPALSTHSPACVLALPGTRPEWPWAPTRWAFIPVPRASSRAGVLWESTARLMGDAGGPSLLLQGQKPSFVLSPTHMLKLFGNLQGYCTGPGSKETFTTSLMNLSQSFNNAAIYRPGLYWIDCRSCTKAHSVSAMKLQRDIRADWNHSVWLHTIKYYNLYFAWLDSLLNWKVNGILTH